MYMIPRKRCGSWRNTIGHRDCLKMKRMLDRARSSLQGERDTSDSINRLFSTASFRDSATVSGVSSLTFKCLHSMRESQGITVAAIGSWHFMREWHEITVATDLFRVTGIFLILSSTQFTKIQTQIDSKWAILLTVGRSSNSTSFAAIAGISYNLQLEAPFPGCISGPVTKVRTYRTSLRLKKPRNESKRFSLRLDASRVASSEFTSN